jgi:putative ABC transport system permease protein
VLSIPRPPVARPVFWLLRDVTLPSLRRHRLRALLTLIGVVVGVQLVMTIQLVSRATMRSFEHTFATIAGEADLQLSNGDVGVSETLIERLAADPGVASVSGIVRGTLATRFGTLTVFGVDLLADQQLRERQFPRRHVHLGDELRFVNAEDSIALATAFANAAGVGLDTPLDATGPTGPTRLVMRGTLDPVGPATLFGGAVGLVDLPTAQRLFGRAGRVDEIDVLLAAGGDRDATTRRLQSLVAGAGTLADPATRLGGIAGLLGGLRAIFAITSVLGITVGAFLVHHAIRSAVLQRRRALAVARALGYRRAVVAAAILAEAGCFGLVGGLFGVVLAVGAARLAIDVVTGAVSVIWTRADQATVVPDVTDVGVALLVGVVSALVAALGPALASARLDVVEQLRSTSTRRRASVGGSTLLVGLGACALACLAFASAAIWETLGADLVAIAIGSTAMTVGYAALAPLVLGALVVPVRWLVGRRGVVWSLAAEHLARDPVRCRGTLGALMAAFAFVLCVTAFVRSLSGTILGWMDQALAADLYVGATPDLPLPAAPTLPGELEGELAGIPGVADVTPTRITLAELDGRMVGFKATRGRQLRVRPFPVVRQQDGYLDAFERGDTVLVSDNLAFRVGLGVGDRVVLASPTGAHAFLVGAIIQDYTIDAGTVTVETETYRRLWRDAQVSVFLVHLAPGATADAVRAGIAERFVGRPPVSVLTAGKFKRATADAIDAAFVLTYAIQLVAACVAGIGVVNFFLAEIVDRRREIGLLRTVALDRRQLACSFTAEAALIGLAGGVLAVAWGWPIARIIVTHSTRMVSGWQLAFDFPWAMAVLTPIVVAVTSACAAIFPVRAAAREPLTSLVGVE